MAAAAAAAAAADAVRRLASLPIHVSSNIAAPHLHLYKRIYCKITYIRYYVLRVSYILLRTSNIKHCCFGYRTT